MIFFSNSASYAKGLFIKIRFFDAANGDSGMIQLSNKQVILIDTGTPKNALRVIRSLKGLKVKIIDHLIISHPHLDHSGGFPGLNFFLRLIIFGTMPSP